MAYNRCMDDPETQYIIDFDSTLVSVETLDELAKITLADDPRREKKIQNIAHITERGMNGEIDFPTSLRERLTQLGITREHIARLNTVLKQHITPSVLHNIKWFREHAPRIHIISGGFRECIVPIAEMLGIDAKHIYANTFVYNAEGHVTGVDEKNLLAQANGKARQAHALALSSDIIIIGDGMTDFEMKTAYPKAKFIYFAEHVRRERVMRLADDIWESFDRMGGDT